MTDAETGHRRGILLVISSPSGAGKTTLARAVAQSERLEFSVSYTTRAPRPGERDGVDYKFVTDDEFTEMVGRKEFAEWAMAKRELEHYGEYDYLVVNDNLETALKELSSIYVAARCARSRSGHLGQSLLQEARLAEEGLPPPTQ